MQFVAFVSDSAREFSWTNALQYKDRSSDIKNRMDKKNKTARQVCDRENLSAMTKYV